MHWRQILSELSEVYKRQAYGVRLGGTAIAVPLNLVKAVLLRGGYEPAEPHATANSCQHGSRLGNCLLCEIEQLQAAAATDKAIIEQLRSDAKSLRADLECLCRMLRTTGYGQGQIDSFAAICEEADALREELNALKQKLIA